MSFAGTIVASEWEPKVLGRERLDARRWMYVVAAPFDMPANFATLLTGTYVVLDDMRFEIRGVEANMPPRPVAAGELVGLLVAIPAIWPGASVGAGGM